MNWTLAVLVATLVALAVTHFTAPRHRAFHPDIYCYDPYQQDQYSGGVPGLCELKARYT